MTNIWVVGSSIVKWASCHAWKYHKGGTQLDLKRHYASLFWQGKRGMRWNQVYSCVKHLLEFEQKPDILILHCSGNDLGQINTLTLRHRILSTIKKLRQELPDTFLVWSQILPRLKWRFELNHRAIERVRKRINSYVAKQVIQLGGGYIRYPEISEMSKGLFAQDGVHLSFMGNELFLYRLQQAIQTFLSSDIKVSPAEGEWGPWLKI